MAYNTVKNGNYYDITKDGEIVEEGYLTRRMAEKRLAELESRSDSDLRDYMAYQAIQNQVKGLEDIRGSLGEYSGPEDLLYTDCAEEYQELTQAITEREVELEKYLPGAKRWAGGEL